MNSVLAELPAGSWTTYGDVAALIGSHPVPVGGRLSTVPAPNAHRVLQVDGTVSPNFRWLEPGRTDDVHEVLRAEGVVFDANKRADPSQRMSLNDLASLAGLDVDSLPEPIRDPHPGQSESLRDRFVEQLSELHDAAVATATLQLVEAWTELGGSLRYGTGQAETSCFVVAREPTEPGGGVWPMIIYPSGSVEVGFQRLRNRPPFDDVSLREEFRVRLSAVPDIKIPAAKLELRPSFPLRVLAYADRRAAILEHLKWFWDTLLAADST
jgi:alkylated DNA nucleotide flippase Atl1